MKKIQLKDLELSIPEISILESRQLMGGMAGYLAEVVVIGNPNDQRGDDNDDRKPDDKPNLENDDRDDNTGNDDMYGDNDQSNGNDSNQHIISIDPKVVEMLDKISPKLLELLKSNGVTIQIDPSIAYSGIYDASTNVITLKEYSINVLYKECVHAIQDSLGIASDANRFNNEFQEHIIGDILMVLEKDLFSLQLSQSKEYSDWIWGITNYPDSRDFDYDAFISGWNTFLDEFRECYSGTDYNVPASNEYDWNWDVFFELFNIK